MDILVVDDDEGICSTMEDILRERNHLVKTANNGCDAINLAKKCSFDLILMDMSMPGLNGLDAYKIMKQYNPLLKVIFMTAYAPEKLIEQSKKDGFEILYKPVNMPKFLNELN